MYVPNVPRFRPKWTRIRSPERPGWIEDDRWTPPGTRHIYADARTGIAVAARAAADPGGVVLLPSYIPEGVVRVLLDAGLEPKFYPVSDDLTLPPEAVLDRISALEPEVLVTVNYFGFADPNLSLFVDAAQDVDAVVIEDCARALFGRDRDGDLLGTRGAASVYSLHKFLPVPNGGLAVGRHLELPAPGSARGEAGNLVSTAGVAIARKLGFDPGQKLPAAVRPSSNGTGGGGLSADGTSSGTGSTWLQSPESPGPLTEAGLAKVRPAVIVERRRKRYESLRSRLEGLSPITPLTPPAHDGAAPYGVVLRVEGGAEQCQSLYRTLADRGLPAERLTWPIHSFSLPRREYPGARALREATLVLPTHHQMPPETVDRVAETVRGELSD